MDDFGIKTEPVEKESVLKIKAEPDEKEITSNENDLCEPCRSENNVAKADGICKECDDLMCNTCFRHHLKAKQCRHHELIYANMQTISTEKEKVEKCKYHGGETIKFYCKKHETVGCGDCMVLGHSTCDPEYINALSTDFKENETFKCLLSKLAILADTVKESETFLHDDKASNELWHEKALEEIRKFRKDIDDYLDTAETVIMSEVDQLRNNNCKYLIKLEENCKALLSKTERLKEKLDTDLYDGNALFIHAVKCKLYIPSLEKAVSKLQSKEEIKKFEFVSDRHLSTVIASAKKLGHFNLSKRTTSEHQTPSALSGDISIQPEDNLECMYEEMEGRKRRKRGTGVDSARVGARVRPGPCFTYDWDHRNKPGTVTSVEPDGTVTVKWDATGKSWSGYRVGAVWNGVELI
ncbi:uncharacterized protein LOC123548465 [Mercenaria mercenaria]|uniref:uncharacterized protein LOC123548465 n=1 Tax=Mercenaria mercenaria TaxID=6596 RepID=UPI00234F7496|nr:uncharacterized protein LOC123548465 [Mercenaria mercenaria]